MPIEIADGAPVSGNRGNTAMAAIPRTSALENGHGVASTGGCTIILILAARPCPGLGRDGHACPVPTPSLHDRRTTPPDVHPRTAASMASARAWRSSFPANLCHRAAFERSSPMPAGVGVTAIETAPSGAPPLRAFANDRRRPFALAIEAVWRKRAVGVVPAQPKARPEGQRHNRRGNSASMNRRKSRYSTSVQKSGAKSSQNSGNLRQGIWIT